MNASAGRSSRRSTAVLNLVLHSRSTATAVCTAVVLEYQSPHFAHGDFPFKFWGDLVLTEPGAQRTKGELDCVMDVSSSFV